MWGFFRRFYILKAFSLHYCFRSYGDFAEWVDLPIAGALAVKGLSLQPAQQACFQLIGFKAIYVSNPVSWCCTDFPDMSASHCLATSEREWRQWEPSSLVNYFLWEMLEFFFQKKKDRLSRALIAVTTMIYVKINRLNSKRWNVLEN